MWALIVILLIGGFLIAGIVIAFSRLFRSRSNDSSWPNEETSAQKEKERLGTLGEAKVAGCLQGIVNAHSGYLYGPCAFKDEQGRSSEIDHILICKAGVFVIETKYIVAVIKGEEDDKRWIKRKRNGVEETFDNPIKQNQAHIRYLKRLWGSGAPWMESVVVFANGNITLVSDLVYDLGSVKAFIESKFQEPRYSQEEVERINEGFIQLLARYQISHEEHVRICNGKKGL